MLWHLRIGLAWAIACQDVTLCAGDTGKGVAVTVGVSYTEYYLNSAHQQMTAYTATSGTLSVICGRLSFALALKVTTCCTLSTLLIWETCAEIAH